MRTSLQFRISAVLSAALFVLSPLASAGEEVHTRGTAGIWTEAGELVRGAIPNDEGWSFYPLAKSVDLKGEARATARVRFRESVDYNGIGIAFIEPGATKQRHAHIRLELSERQNNIGVGGFSANESHYAGGMGRAAERDIKVGEWYELTLIVLGTRVRGLLDGVEMCSAEIPDLASLPRELQIAFFIIEADAEFQLTAGDGKVLEELIIPNTRPEKVTSQTILEAGRDYVIEVSGTIDDWGNKPHGIDAVWCFAEWRCGKSGEVWNQLRINDKGLTELAGPIPYNPEHRYRLTYRGQGKPVEFYCIDAQGSSGDNLGELTVRILGNLASVSAPRAPSSMPEEEPASAGTPTSIEPPEPVADELGVQFLVEAYGRDESDGSDVSWNFGYPNPSFGDDPGRRGSPNARWKGAAFLVGNYLALGIEGLEAPFPPAHTLAVGYTVSLTGATFEDGSTRKTVVLHRFSGTPADNEFLEFVRIIPQRYNR